MVRAMGMVPSVLLHGAPFQPRTRALTAARRPPSSCFNNLCGTLDMSWRRNEEPTWTSNANSVFRPSVRGCIDQYLDYLGCTMNVYHLNGNVHYIRGSNAVSFKGFRRADDVLSTLQQRGSRLRHLDVLRLA
eukprot:419374-Hanusia_phi.AAC.1